MCECVVGLRLRRPTHSPLFGRMTDEEREALARDSHARQVLALHVGETLEEEHAHAVRDLLPPAELSKCACRRWTTAQMRAALRKRKVACSVVAVVGGCVCV